MKKTILGITSAIVLAASTTASAGQTVYGTITNVVENWTYETRRIPTETCNTVRIPITVGSYSI